MLYPEQVIPGPGKSFVSDLIWIHDTAMNVQYSNMIKCVTMCLVGCTAPGGPGPHRVRSPGGAGPVPAEKEGTAPPTAQSAHRGEHSKRYVSSTGVSLDGAKIQNYCLKIKLFKKLTSW